MGFRFRVLRFRVFGVFWFGVLGFRGFGVWGLGALGLFGLGFRVLGLPYRILNINHKKELLRGLWVGLRVLGVCMFRV